MNAKTNISSVFRIPSGKHTNNYGTSTCLSSVNQQTQWPLSTVTRKRLYMARFKFGKSTINEPFSIANCNKLPEGIDHYIHYIP